MSGWIKIHRKLLDNPVVTKDASHLAVWIHLLLNATHKEKYALFKGRQITLRPGQLITGRKSIAKLFKISESKVQRILKSFEIEQQIEQHTSSQNRLITILNWHLYQSTEHQNEHQPANHRTASEQLPDTYKNLKKYKNEKKEKNHSSFTNLLPVEQNKTFKIIPGGNDE